MSSAEFRSRCRAACVAAVAVLVPGIAPGAAQAAIVVASAGPSAGAYPVGKKLDDTSAVTLRAGDSVTILDSRGTRVLKGAGTFAVSAGSNAPPKASTFAVLTMQRSAQRVRTGAVRAGKGSTPPASPNLWFVDVASSGKRCLVAGQPVRLWRLGTDVAATYTVAPAAGGAGVPVAFPAGAMVAPWNVTSLPVADGGKYTVSLGGKPVSAIEFAVLPNQPADAEAMAATLIDKGCTAQLALLSTTLAQP